jgi:hypothetical protein
MSDVDTLLEQASSLPLDERQRLIKRLALSSNMAAGPAWISLDPGSPRAFTCVGALGSLAALGVLLFGLLLVFIPCPDPMVPAGPSTVGVGLVMLIFMGTLLLLGLQLWNEQDQLAEADFDSRTSGCC